jgi:hypothetical protein
MASDSTRGIVVARTVSVARRISALFAMAALVGLLVILVWRVYLHHEHGVSADEPAVVAIQAHAA